MRNGSDTFPHFTFSSTNDTVPISQTKNLRIIEAQDLPQQEWHSSAPLAFLRSVQSSRFHLLILYRVDFRFDFISSSCNLKMCSALTSSSTRVHPRFHVGLHESARPPTSSSPEPQFPQACVTSTHNGPTYSLTLHMRCGRKQPSHPPNLLSQTPYFWE